MSKDESELFEEFFDRYYQRVYSFFIRQGWSAEEAEELTQETFARVFQNMGAYRGGNEIAYIMTVTKNIWKNELRRRSAVKRGDPPVTLDDPNHPIDDRQQTPLFGAVPGSPEEETLRKEKIAALRREIRALPPRMRRAVLLRVQGLSYREIAAAMNTTIDAVKKLLYEARKQLKVALSSWASDLLGEGVRWGR